MFEIEKENYEQCRDCLKEILDSLSTLSTLTIENREYSLKKHICADLKMLNILYGLNACNSKCACVWCPFDKTISSNNQLEWPISRTIKEGIRIATAKSTPNHGHIKKPILQFIDFNMCVIDTLHLYLRLSERFVQCLFEVLNNYDQENSADLNKRPYLKRFVNFLVNTCKIFKPTYSPKENEHGDKIKMQSLNSTDFEKIFGKISILELYPEIAFENDLVGINFIFKTFHEIICQLKDNRFVSIINLKKKLSDFQEVLLAQHYHNTKNLSPYLHALVHHLPELIEKHGYIHRFNLQGLEKLNSKLKSYYRNKSTGQSKVYLKQLISQRNRCELYSLYPTYEELILNFDI